jgi:hypothetical protein
MTVLYTSMALLALWFNRHDRHGLLVASIMFTGLVAAVGFSIWIPRPDIAAVLCLIEAGVSLALVFSIVSWRGDDGWCRDTLRAAMIGIICLGKIGIWTVFIGTATASQWNSSAAMFNGLFVAQIAIAGGLGDGLARTFIDMLYRVRRRVMGSLQVGGVR